MADIANPAIRKELDVVEEDLKGYGDTATVLLRHYHASTQGLVGLGLLPGRDQYQHEVNRRLIDMVMAVATMAAFTNHAVWGLKTAIEVMAKERPKPKPAPPPGLFDSRK